MDGGGMNFLRPFSSQRGGRFGDRSRRGGHRGDRGDRDQKDPGDRNGDLNNSNFDGKRMRKAIHRKTVDYNSSMIHYLENRIFQRDHRDRRAIQPDSLYAPQLMPPMAMEDKPMNCVTTKFVRTSTNKFRCPVFCLAWTPEGRRLVTGASSGEFTLWNGLTFNFETILQAHDVSVRAMRWSHNDLWMVTADHGGYVKYWQSNMNNVKMYQGHKDPIRGVSFCPSDGKFATCSDDGTVRIWDFMRCTEEQILRGHGADVKCVDWHPHKSLVASGSKDNQQPVKLWDPRSGSSLATLHAHKHTVMDLRWNQNGHWLLTASRDHLLKVFDIRNMKTEMQTFKGHKKEATSLAWHPLHESLFTSGGSDGSLMFWIVGCDREVGSIEEAHEGMVWGLDWHPLGHILVSGSNDHTTKFWTRNRPGDEMRDKYNLNNLPTGVEQEILEYSKEDNQAVPSLPGMGLEHGLPEHLRPKEEEKEDEVPSIPGLDWNQDSPFFKQIAAEKMPSKKIPFARPIPRNFEKAWLGHDTQQTSMEKGNAANKPGILGMPPNMNMALNVLMQGNTAGIPQEMMLSMITEMQKQPQLMALGQQLLLKHQQDLLQHKQQNPGMMPAPLPQMPKPLQQLPSLLQPGLQQPQNAVQQQQQQQNVPNQQQQQQPSLSQAPNPVQQAPPRPARPALLQTPTPGGMGGRPMGAEGPNQFQPPQPGQPQFRPEGSGLPDQNQFGPSGPGPFAQPHPPFPQQSLMPQPAKENFRPVPGQSLGQGVGDQDHRRPYPPLPSSTPQAPSTSQASPMDTDLRRPAPSMDDFPMEGDQDFRHTPPVSRPLSMGQGGFPPPQATRPSQSQDLYEDSDMRAQSFMGQEARGYEDDAYGDQYGDFDLRMSGSVARGGDVDERFQQREMGGQYSQGDMHGYHGLGGFQDSYGPSSSFGNQNQYEDDHGGRKRSWQEGPGRGTKGGQDSRRGARGGGGGVRVYNGPAGPLDHSRRGGMQGGRGRGGRGGW